MNTALEFPYKPRLGPSLVLISLFLVSVVFMADVAVNNDEGLIIDGLITLDTGSATVFYWVIVVATFFPLFIGVKALRLSLQKNRRIVLSEKDVTIPGLMSSTTVVVPLNDITRLMMSSRTLIVCHGADQTKVSQVHFADKASFERFLSHLKAAIGALHPPANATDPTSAQES